MASLKDDGQADAALNLALYPRRKVVASLKAVLADVAEGRHDRIHGRKVVASLKDPSIHDPSAK